MKNIILSIQQQLAGNIPQLRYIDEDWGQLSYEQPPVQFPCALIDIANVDYSQLGEGYQQATANVTILVADMRLINSSARASQRNDAHFILDLLANIHQKLQLFAPNVGNNEKAAPLIRITTKKEAADKGTKIYSMTYQTAFTVPKTKNLIPVAVQPVITIDYE